MKRILPVSLLAFALMASASFAQDGPLRRAGRNIRGRIENEVAREQISAQERDVLNRVARRIEWDKRLVNSTLRLEVQPGGAVFLRGSVLNVAAKKLAVDLTENTLGVTSVVDELAIVKDVKVIQARPATTVIESGPATTIIESKPGTTVIEGPAPPPVAVPPGTKIIVKP